MKKEIKEIKRVKRIIEKSRQITIKKIVKKLQKMPISDLNCLERILN